MFESYNMACAPYNITVGALKLNTGLRELYIADNDLGVTDALQLAALLRSNTYLQLLDVRYVPNCLQQRVNAN